MTARAHVKALYMISVAAQLSGVHPQTLRIYEREGLINPERTSGQTRLYSDEDVELVRLIQGLTQKSGVNLAGVKMIIQLKKELEQFRKLLALTENRMAEIESELLAELEKARSKNREALVKATGKEMTRQQTFFFRKKEF